MLAGLSCRLKTSCSGLKADAIARWRGPTAFPSPRWHQPCVRQASTSAVGKRVILAVESSADDSCCAIVTSEREILANIVVKQHEINAEYGGINPLLAQRAHEANVPEAVGQALREAKLSLSDVDAVAYTRGPGMRACLTVGAVAARTVAAVAGKPCLGIHHMQAHALTPLLTETRPPEFPFLVLLVSGGHTQIVLAEGINKFRIVLDKLDISIGAAFDKVARHLRLPHSAKQGLGSTLERYAALPPLPPFDVSPAPALPVPLSKHAPAPPHVAGVCRPAWSVGPNGQAVGFSFGGLQTAAQRLADKLAKKSRGERGSLVTPGTDDAIGNPGAYLDDKPEPVQREVARRFQHAAITHLCQQTRKVILRLTAEGLDTDKLGGVVASGGVASNQYLRSQLALMLSTVRADGSAVPAFYPPIELCTDNAAMIAWAAILRTKHHAAIQADPPGLPILPKWSLEDLEDSHQLGILGI